MLLEIMIDSATQATMTIAVAADSPPMKAASVRIGFSAVHRQRDDEDVGVDAWCRT